MKIKRNIVASVMTALVLTATSPITLHAQSGGDFTVTQSVIAGGGGQNSMGGSFSLDSTLGQAVAGNALSGSPFAITSGFLNFPADPTAAPSISGHLNYRDTAIAMPNITLTLTGTNGFVARTTLTDTNGDYLFANVPAGNDYTVTPSRAPLAHDPSITAFDASRAARFAAQLLNLTLNQQTAGDSSNNGACSAFDASQIARYELSIPSSGSIAGGWKFIPASLSIINLTASQTNKNLAAILVGDISGNWAPSAPIELAPSSPSTLSIPVSLPTKQDPSGSPSIIPISVGDTTGQGIGSYALDISFDPAVLQLQSTPFDTAGTLSNGWLITPNTLTSGHLILNAFGTTDLSGQGVLINLKFNVVGGMGSTSSLTWASFNFNEGSPTDTDVNGFFTAVGPTAATAGISGQIVTADGLPIGGTTVTVLGGSRIIRAITDSNGFYKIENLEVGGFYTVTPSRANFVFAPGTRAFALVGNRTDAEFTGTTTGPVSNPLDSPEFFVRQQYLDFLGREPEQSGLDYWSGQLRACGADVDCVNKRRLDISAAFFIAEEFQQSGSFIYDMYTGSLGRRPLFTEYSADRVQLIGGPNLEAEKMAFAQNFVQRPEFVARYQAHTMPEVFVDVLLENIRLAANVDLRAQRDNLIAVYNSGNDVAQSRALVVRSITDNAAFRQSQYNSAFVLVEYFGFLHRNPDQQGYDFWLMS